MKGCTPRAGHMGRTTGRQGPQRHPTAAGAVRGQRRAAVPSGDLSDDSPPGVASANSAQGQWVFLRRGD